MKLSSLKNIALLIFGGYFILTVSIVLSKQESSKFNLIEVVKGNEEHKIGQYLSGLTKENLLDSFNYKQYNKSNPFKDINTINQDIKTIDSVFVNQDNLGQQVLANALTQFLREDEAINIFSTYNPDSLLSVIDWVEKFEAYARIDKENELLYTAVYEFWLGEISSYLSNRQHENTSLQYDFKFQFLAQKCAVLKYPVNIKESKIEKFKKNLIAGNWSHLINATWNDSPFYLRLVYITGILFTLLAYFISIYCIIKKTDK